MATFGEFIQSNYQLGNIMAGFPSLLDQFISIEGEALNNIGNFANNITGKAQQVILWKMQKRTQDTRFNFNNASVIEAFVPGRFAKVNVTTNPTEKDTRYRTEFTIPRKTAKKDIKTYFPSISNRESITEISNRNIKNANGAPQNMVFYIKYKNATIDGRWGLLKLKASIGHQKLVDTFVNNWTGHSAFGRTQKNYIYTETERTLPLSFYEYAYSREELDVLYLKLNQLARLNYGIYESITDENNQVTVQESLKQSNIIYLTLGNLYREMPAIINRMSFEFDEDLWDIDQTVPMMVKINMNLTLLHNENPTANSNFYYIGTEPKLRTDIPR